MTYSRGPLGEPYSFKIGIPVDFYAVGFKDPEPYQAWNKVELIAHLSHPNPSSAPVRIGSHIVTLTWKDKHHLAVVELQIGLTGGPNLRACKLSHR